MKEIKDSSMFACVFLAILFSVMFFSLWIWLQFMSQNSDINNYDLVGKIRYVLDIFTTYVLLEPVNQLASGMFTLLMELEPSGKMVRLYNEMPIRWFYGISALFTFLLVRPGDDRSLPSEKQDHQSKNV